MLKVKKKICFGNVTKTAPQLRPNKFVTMCNAFICML